MDTPFSQFTNYCGECDPDPEHAKVRRRGGGGDPDARRGPPWKRCWDGSRRRSAT